MGLHLGWQVSLLHAVHQTLGSAVLWVTPSTNIPITFSFSDKFQCYLVYLGNLMALFLFFSQENGCSCLLHFVLLFRSSSCHMCVLLLCVLHAKDLPKGFSLSYNKNKTKCTANSNNIYYSSAHCFSLI